jgi:hypothetical protein
MTVLFAWIFVLGGWIAATLTLIYYKGEVARLKLALEEKKDELKQYDYHDVEVSAGTIYERKYEIIE